jgi:hypothetical protein
MVADTLIYFIIKARLFWASRLQLHYANHHKATSWLRFYRKAAHARKYGRISNLFGLVKLSARSVALSFHQERESGYLAMDTQAAQERRAKPRIRAHQIRRNILHNRVIKNFNKTLSSFLINHLLISCIFVY